MYFFILCLIYQHRPSPWLVLQNRCLQCRWVKPHKRGKVCLGSYYFLTLTYPPDLPIIFWRLKMILMQIIPQAHFIKNWFLSQLQLFKLSVFTFWTWQLWNFDTFYYLMILRYFWGKIRVLIKTITQKSEMCCLSFSSSKAHYQETIWSSPIDCRTCPT